MQVIVAARCCRFTVEGNLHHLAIVGRKIDGDIFTCSSNGVKDMFRTAVVPLTQDMPCIVGIDQDDESVISLQSVVFNRIFVVIVRQGEVEAQVLAQSEFRCHQPILDIGCIDIELHIILTQSITGRIPA